MWKLEFCPGLADHDHQTTAVLKESVVDFSDEFRADFKWCTWALNTAIF